MAIFPNPTSGTVTISHDSPFDGSSTLTMTQVQIFDLFGRMIYQSEMQSRNIGTKSEIQLDVSSFSKGVYFVEVSGAQKVSRGRLVKQ